MNTQADSPKTFVAGEALAANRRVKLSSGTVIYSDAGEDYIGVTQQAAASAAPVAVRLIGEGSLAIECAGAVTAYAAVYGANDGKIDDTVSGKCIGHIQETGADGKVCEVIPNFNGPIAALTAAALTDSTGGAAGATLAAPSSITATNPASAAALTQTTLADSSGGVSAASVTAIGGTFSAGTISAIKNGFASVIARLAQLKVDVAAVRTGSEANNTAVDALIVDVTAVRTAEINHAASLAAQVNALRVDSIGA